MPEINVRHHIIDSLRLVLPDSWRLVPNNTNLDELSPNQTVVMLNLQSVEKLPQAPLSHRSASFLLTVIEPKVDPATREDALDDKLIDLLAAIDDIENLSWSKAERGLANANGSLGFEITLSFPYKKEA